MIGLAVGSTAGLVVAALIIYRRIIRSKSHRVVLDPRPAPRLVDTDSEETLVQQAPNDETLTGQPVLHGINSSFKTYV